MYFKKNLIYFLFFILLLFPSVGMAQHIHGLVTEESNGKVLPVPGANIYWMGTTKGAVSDSLGLFHISPPPSFPAQLVISHIGFEGDTIFLNALPHEELTISLTASHNLSEVEVSGRGTGFEYSSMAPINVQTIGREVLRKAACCTLSESFETNATVDVVESDAITGTRKVQMLGLDGIYSQILMENGPLVRGLNSPYGLDHVPGPWVNAINITKGPGSVVNGYESISGQINLDFVKPEEGDPYYLDVYGNHQGRFEVNGIARKKINDHWTTLLAANGKYFENPMDNNGDGFVDMPVVKEVNFMNRWNYQSDNWHAAFGIQALTDEKRSGQLDFFSGNEDAVFGSYGTGINTNQVDGFLKTGKLFSEETGSSLGIVAHGSWYDQKSFWGLRKYEGEQYSFSGNLIYQRELAPNHMVRAGLSYQLDDYQEMFQDSIFNRTEKVPGVYAEYSYNVESKYTAVVGARYDDHNIFGGQFTPRVHLKYHFSPLTTVRISGGSGFRSSNPIAENPSAFVSSRRLVVMGEPRLEKAWNTGFSFLHKFNFLGREAYFNVDYYHTWFEDQVILDFDNHTQRILIYALDGRSVSHNIQGEINFKPVKNLDLTMAYKWQETKMEFLQGELLKPLVPRHRALVNLAYSTSNKRWVFDVTANGFALSRIPSTSGNPPEHQRQEWSDEYMVLHGQITRVFKKFEVFAGFENLLNYKQPNPIIGADNPFGENFDASMIWGPLNGQVFYTGARFNFN